MKTVIFRGCVLGLLGSAIIAGPAFAQEGATDQSRSVARLEALLLEQQRQIERLEQQVAATSVARDDAQRVEATRQIVREILSEQEFRESLMPGTLQAGYDDGFFIRSSDEKFLMKVNGGVQFRWTHYGTRAGNRYTLPGLQRDDRTGFDVQRIRLAFSGWAYDKDLTYYMEYEADAPDGYDVVASEIWANYRFDDAFQFRAGLIKLFSTRYSTIPPLQQQGIDIPLTEAVMGTGWGIGAKFWGLLFDDRLEYHLTIANSLAQGHSYSVGRTITPDPAELDSNPAILFRAIWHAISENPRLDFLTMYDLPFHKSPVLDFGFHYAFDDNLGDVDSMLIPFPRQTLLPGGFGLTTTQGLQVHQFGLDAAFKYCGFSATGEYIVRVVDVRRAWRTPFAPWWLLSGDDSTVAQHGAYVQAGYFLPIPGWEEKVEAFARFGGISTLAEDTEGTWEYSAGVNYYFNEDVKLQADFVKVSEVPIQNSYASLANVNDDALVFRVQLQVAF